MSNSNPKNKKRIRRERALNRLEKQLVTRICINDEEDINNIQIQIENLSSYLAGKKKSRKKKEKVTVGVQVESIDSKDKYWLEIFSIAYSKVKRSDRRKNKGKSRKKMRTQKSVTFLKKVVLQPGLLQRYRDGLMGLSTKTHSFRIRKDEEFNYN